MNFFMKLLLAILLLFTTGKLKAQESDSIITLHFSSGEIRATCPIINGKLNGWFSEFRKSGSLIFRYKIVNDQPIGQKEKYDTNGVLIERYDYDYINEVKHGYSISYRIDGRINEEGNYVNGMRQGIWKAHGNIPSSYAIFHYTDDRKDGLYEYYYLGNLSERGNFKNGFLHGTFVSYDTEGEITKIEYWEDSHCDNTKSQNFVPDAKPDYTKEIIDGIEYIWFDGRKLDMNRR